MDLAVPGTRVEPRITSSLREEVVLFLSGKATKENYQKADSILNKNQRLLKWDFLKMSGKKLQ